MSDGIARFKDFSDDSEPIQFKVGPEIFTCLPTIPLKKMSALSGIAKGGGVDAMVDNLIRVFGGVLEPDSYKKFLECLEGTAHPISMKQITEILPWLLEQYGLRPTEASSGSAESLSETGASSTDGPSVEGATSEQ